MADGFFEITHNGFALVGLAIVFAALALSARPGPAPVRRRAAHGLAAVAQARARSAVTDLEPTAIDRTTAASPHELPKQQAAVAYWLSKKYRVAVEPLSVLVAEAFELGKRTKLDPTLILAIMAVESSFNPFAQSHVGAQGLMQVMTRVHGEKYESAGGTLTAFDPVTNMRVGVKVLQECIARAGSLEGGLQATTSARPTSPTTAAMPARCWPSTSACARWSAAARRHDRHAAPPARAAQPLPGGRAPAKPEAADRQKVALLARPVGLRDGGRRRQLHSAGTRLAIGATLFRCIALTWNTTGKRAACGLAQAFSRSPGQPLFG